MTWEAIAGIVVIILFFASGVVGLFLRGSR